MKDGRLTGALVFFGIIFFATPILSEDSYKVQYTALFIQTDLSFDKLLGYDRVRLKDGDWISDLGKPMLPAKTIQIALPPGMAVKEAKIVDAKEEEISGKFDIFPAQPPRRTDFLDEDTAFVAPDKGTYSSSQPYPSKVVEFSYQTDLAGQGIAVIQLYPLRYLPSEKKLILYTSISIEIEGAAGYRCGDYLSPNITEKDRKTYEQMIKDMVVNPQEVQLSIGRNLKSSMLPPATFNHVIITSDSFASFFQPLADWHTQKGVRDTPITTSWIYGHYSGDNNRQKIRNFIQDANSTWGTSYFLLGGEYETVPFEYRIYCLNEFTPSDQYYSDYDDDWTHEVFVGRVSVGNPTEIATFVNKVLKYEKDPPRTNYPLDVLLIGMDLSSNTPCEDLKEAIHSYIPPQFNVTKVYDSRAGNHRDSVLYYLNAGQNLVNHADHANTTVLGTGSHNHDWLIDNSDVDALNNNDQMSIVVSLGCFPYKLEADDCIAEHSVIYNPNQAAVAFIGNTRTGYIGSGNPDYLSGRLDKEWWVSLFSRSRYNLGQTLVVAKHYFDNSNDVEKHCEWTFNLLGEPEMPIWTDEPDSFIMTCLSRLLPETSSFSVHIQDATTNIPVESAYVCLWKKNDVYLTGYTSAGGEVDLSPSPSSGGVMYVTATKHNYLPCEQIISVFLCGDVDGDGGIDIGDVIHLINYLYEGGSAPFPLEAGDVNCDSIVDIGDVVYLINYLFRNGPAPACS